MNIEGGRVRVVRGLEKVKRFIIIDTHSDNSSLLLFLWSLEMCVLDLYSPYEKEIER